MFAVVAFAPSFNAPAISGRVQQQEISMSAAASRREILSKVAGSAVLAAGVQGASAKAGQFGNIGIFGYGTSSPYVGPKVVPSSTSAGSQFVENTQSISREKAAYEKSAKLLVALQKDIDSKTW